MWPFKYPYTNFHEMNLDWIIERIKSFQNDINGIPATVKAEVEKEYSESGVDEYAKNAVNAYLSTFTADEWVIFGDSYAIGVNAGGEPNGWAYKAQNMLGLATEKWHTDFCQGGAGFTRAGEDGYTWVENAQRIGALFNPERVKGIIVCGGANDTYVNQSEVNLAMQRFITAIRIFNPHIPVYLFCVGCWYGTHPEYNKNIVPAYRGASKYGFTYAVGSEYLIRLSMYNSGDGLHPNASGNELIAQNVVNVINGGEVQQGAGPDAWEICPTLSMFTRYDGKNIVLSSRSSGRIDVNLTNFEMNGNNSFQIESPINYINQPESDSFLVIPFVVFNSGHTVSGEMSIIPKGDTAICYPIAYETGGAVGFFRFTGTTIFIPPFERIFEQKF